jgi:WD40 repeat protein/3',5'-cyclic AMP phosphodiesterase CpdA
MPDSNSITIVHLSDLHFGEQHRHGRDVSPEGEDQPPSLAELLIADLSYLKDQYGIQPDLVVVSGDLSETALPDEFRQASACLNQVREELGLSTREVLIVPGNHDISWLKCQAYLFNCMAEQIEPVAPLWPKYELYADMFADFYGCDEADRADGPQFPRDLPWTLFEVPQLRTVAAGLNSTINESHRTEDHYGHCGRAQYEWFAEQLARYEEMGWLRIGILHHNPRIADLDDRKSLRDVQEFEKILLPRLNLVLHGHRHERRPDSMGSAGIPVLGVGSAGVKAAKRAPEIPNQYQVLKVRRGGIELLARRFEPGVGWVGDTGVGQAPESWTLSIDRPLARVHEAFSSSSDREQERDWVAPPGRLLGSDLLHRIREVIKVRHPDARVQRFDAGPGRPQSYLLVTVREGKHVQQYPIGAIDGPVDREAIKAFAEQVDAKYRVGDRTMLSVLVHQGPAAPEELRLWAGSLGVDVQEMVKFQGMYNLEPYADRQITRMQAGEDIYPSSLFIPQRFSLANPRSGTSPEIQTDLLARLQEWAGDPDGRFVVVLGDFGHGKTFLLRELTKVVHDKKTPPVIPILIQLRDLEKAQSLDQLLAAQLAQGDERRIDLEHLRYLIREGRVLLLFDGFDELVLRVTYEEAAKHLAHLVKAGEGRAKVVITSRTQHFLSDQQVETALLQLTDIPTRQLVKLHDFDDGQVLEYLTKMLGGRADEAAYMMGLLDDVRDLIGLARNPRMLSFIMQLDRKRLERIRDQDREISASRLYEELLTQWLEFEHNRAKPVGSSPTLAVPERWSAVTDLALRLWSSDTETLRLSEVSEVAGTLNTLAELKLTTDQAAHMIGSGTLLVRTSDSRFKFVHRSVMEWLVTHHIAKNLRPGGDTPIQLVVQPISDLMAEFLKGQVPSERLISWAKTALTAGPQTDAEAWNALLLLRTLQDHPGPSLDSERVLLSGRDLSGIDLTGMDLSGAELRGTNLSKATLIGANLSRADLSGAVLDGADLSNADLSDAQISDGSFVSSQCRAVRFTRSNLSGSDLFKCDVPDADFTSAYLAGVRFRRANLLHSTHDPAIVESFHQFGTAFTADLPPKLNVSSASYAATESLAWSPDGQILAAGDSDGTIQFWDTDDGFLLRTLEGHAGRVSDVAWSPDGRTLATASDDKFGLWDPQHGSLLRTLESNMETPAIAWNSDRRTLATTCDGGIRLWNTYDGSLLHTLESDTEISAVAWHPDGHTLAAPGPDRSVQLWDARGGSLLHTLTGHSGRVRSIAWSPWGLLATAGNDEIRVWDGRDGSLLHVLEGSGEASTLAWHRDGRTLAAPGPDGFVRLWDTRDGSLKRTLTGHNDSVNSLAWSPNPDRHILAIAGSGGIRLWNTRDGSLIHTLRGRGSTMFTVAWNPDGHTLAASGDNGAWLWDTSSGSLRRTLRIPGFTMSAVAWHPDGYALAASDLDGKVQLWDTRDGSILRTLEGHTNRVSGAAWAPDGRILATNGGGGIRLWDANGASVMQTLEGHSGWATGAAWNPDGRTLATASINGVQLWDTRDGSLLHTLQGQNTWASTVAWNPDGRTLATDGPAGEVQLWDTREMFLFHSLDSHCGSISGLAWNPDGHTLAVCGSLGAELWDSHNRSLLCAIEGHNTRVTSVAWSPDGRTLATSGSDRTVRLWTRDGRELATLICLADGSAVFSPDGLSYRVDGTVAGEFWWTVGLVRFDPGQLEDLPEVRTLPPGPLAPDGS